jgi:uncharacterized phage protein (TIGR01671 family)
MVIGGNMREIKFRAWNKDLEKMCDSSTLQEWMHEEAKSAVVEHDLRIEREETAEKEYEHLIFMQYTGLKDKNGKEIYEGDVINFAYTTANFNVEWCNGAFKLMERNSMLSLELGDMWLHECTQGYQCSNSKYKIGELEVIDNIYEDTAMSNAVDVEKKIIYPKGTPKDLPLQKSGKKVDK